MADIKANTEKINMFILDKFVKNELDNESLVEIIKHVGSMLNLQTISDYARTNKISYQGVKKCRKIKTIFNVKFVIDND